jgi:hypothetical protein
MINYHLIHESIGYYQQKGFTRIETPWTVSKQIDDITRPKDRIPFELKHNDKRLVASGEQSFLYLYLKEFLPKGKYQTITPCFRNESFDFTHSKYFIKNELIQTDIVSTSELNKVVDICYTFFNKQIPDLKIVKTDEGFDIMKNEYELGSYGIRECEYLKWIYATGCAEPRLSRIINLYGIS